MEYVMNVNQKIGGNKNGIKRIKDREKFNGGICW